MEVTEQLLKNVQVHLLQQLAHVVFSVHRADLLASYLHESLSEMLLAHLAEKGDTFVETLVVDHCC